jgi:hypothetical protein
MMRWLNIDGVIKPSYPDFLTLKNGSKQAS